MDIKIIPIKTEQEGFLGELLRIRDGKSVRFRLTNKYSIVKDTNRIVYPKN